MCVSIVTMWARIGGSRGVGEGMWRQKRRKGRALGTPPRCQPHELAGLQLQWPGRAAYDLPQPGRAAACRIQVAICASSRSSSWTSIQRASLALPPDGAGRSDVPWKKVTLT
jgi:hypothetical protein